MTKTRVLIVEDNRQVAENLFEFLGDVQYQLDYAADGLTALHLLATQSYDIIVLDVMLPGVDGFTLCRRIREDLKLNIPILLITARDSIEDKVVGFRNGADDYLVKPFNLRELELRIQALIKRGGLVMSDLKADRISFNTGTLVVTDSEGHECSLSGFHATLFELLIRLWPNFASYQSMSQALWGEDDGDPNTIRTHVYALRKDLIRHFGKGMIRTIHGRGYCLDPKALD